MRIWESVRLVRQETGGPSDESQIKVPMMTLSTWHAGGYYWNDKYKHIIKKLNCNIYTLQSWLWFNFLLIQELILALRVLIGTTYTLTSCILWTIVLFR